MTLPASGPISLNNVNVELGLSGTTSINMNQASVRTLFGKASGAISMSDGYGKSNRAAVSYTFTSSTANASLNVSSLGGYSAGTSDITVTVNSGVYLYATSTGNYGLNLTGATAGDTVTLVNNGFILGQGGVGGAGLPSGTAGTNAGPALNIGTGVNITINNTNGSAYIAGGGGGGGAGGNYGPAGGGAGGGTGGYMYQSYGNITAPGGAGGGIGASGSNGNVASKTICGELYVLRSGAGGGRILPGSGGAGSTSDAGTIYGGGAGGGGKWRNGAAGGNGGSANAVGGAGTGTGGLKSGGGGGGWGASGGTSDRAAGVGGKAVNLNGKSVTWVSGDTSRVYGAVS